MNQEVILCVDDEQMILNSLSEQLYKHLGDRYIYEFAESGDEALEVIQELTAKGHNLVMLISDQIMPGMKGDGLLIEFNKRFPNAIKILLTGQAGLESAINAINNADLFRYLIKPWVEENFIATIKKGLRQYYLISEMEKRLVADHLTRLESAGQEEYAESQAHLIRQTVFDWTGKVGQTEDLQYRNKNGQFEIIRCEIVNLKDSKYAAYFENVPFYRKCLEIKARQVEATEIVDKNAEGADVIANVGDWIVTNPLEKRPYAIEADKFATLYVPKPNSPGVYASVGKPVKAYQTDSNVAFLAPWGQPQIMTAGSYLLDSTTGERYGVERELFEVTYQRLEHVPMRFKNHAGESLEIPCRVVDLHSKTYNALFESAGFYIKSIKIYARQATSVEVIDTPLDATKNTASPGDWIVNNPGERPYIVRARDFPKLYQAKEEEPGAFVSIGKPVKAVQPAEDIVFIAPWGELQAVQKGGSIIQGVDGGRYGIDQQSLKNTYMKLSYLPTRFKKENGAAVMVSCRIIDLKTKHFDQLFAQASLFHKQVEIRARQAKEPETIFSEATASQITAKPGDWIVRPESKQPYIILNEQFLKLYRPNEGDANIFVSLSKPVRRIELNEDVIFVASWGELQGVESGGSLLENSEGERYGISPQDFARDYRPL